MHVGSSTWCIVCVRDAVPDPAVCMQVTPEGLNAILVYRKATLQLFAIPVERSTLFNMRNWIASAGGPTFVDIIRNVARDGRGLEIMLDILRLSEFPLTPRPTTVVSLVCGCMSQ